VEFSDKVGESIILNVLHLSSNGNLIRHLIKTNRITKKAHFIANVNVQMKKNVQNSGGIDAIAVIDVAQIFAYGVTRERRMHNPGSIYMKIYMKICDPIEPTIPLKHDHPIKTK
jgi:hypothetical protein